MSAVPSQQLIEDASALQRRAADPAAHVWVMASAGTGKTTVLVQRFIRLVLAGTDPARILCLTYTKAAATQMKERILRRLSSWVCMDDRKLRAELTEMMQQTPSATQTMQARQLFGVLLDQLDSLNIMTIHAFCQSLLARFQVEAGLPGGADIMDDPSSKLLLSDVLSDILAHDENPYIERLAQYTADGSWEDLIGKIIQHRSGFRALFEGNVHAETEIGKLLRIEDGVTLDELRQRALHDGRIPWTLLEALPPIKDVDVGGILEALRTHEQAQRGDLFPSYAALFLTKTGTPRKTVKFKEEHLSVQYFEEAQRVLDVYAAERALMTASASRDLTALARAALERYQERKTQRGVLDYDDLIERTLELLSRVDAADWVRFKLDGGIDQVLLDEAQDTSPAQWQIIAQIVQEYFAGIGRRDPEDRTLFVVGDTKQSIFSFQGASPETARQYHDDFMEAAKAARRPWNDVPLTTSFRTAQDILDVVDATASWGDPVKHDAGKAHAGRVEFYPAIQNDDGKTKTPPWTLPDSIAPSPRRLLVEQAADKIASLLQSRIALPSEDDAAITASDILVLVRTRSHLPRPLIQALRHRGVPVSGLDRFDLTDDIAVQDILAALRWSLFPDDDLTLAGVLKSPLVGWDDDALGTLAIGREGRLWDIVREREPTMAAWLRAIMQRTRTDTITDTVRHILERPCPADAVSGRRALHGRLGPSCLDALDQLLLYAETRQKDGDDALAFLQHLEQFAPTLKREMEGDSGSGVRIMTAHGAKGLEAPVVLLIDTLASASDVGKVDELQWAETAKGAVLPLWAPRESDRADALSDLRAAAKDEALAEYNRLLYVAMTRAKDALIVMGATDAKTLPEDSWYASIERGLQRLETRQEGDVTVYGRWTPQPAAEAATAPIPAPADPHPAAAIIEAQEETIEEDPAVWQNARARSIGRQWHTLLERAIDRPQAEWDEHWDSWLGDLPDLDAGVATQRLSALRDHAEYGFLFQPGGAAEVAFITRTETGVSRGRIDRLVKTGDALWIIDYKTRLTPENAEQMATYRAQLAGYSAALTGLSDGLPIRCLLVDVGTGMVVPLDL